MEHDAADELHVEVPHAEHAHRCLPHGGERLGKDVVERLAARELLAELGGLRGKLFVRQRLELRF
jgi:hypothetical protein